MNWKITARYGIKAAMEQMPENKAKNTPLNTGTELGKKPVWIGLIVVVLLIVCCFLALLLYRTIEPTFNLIKDFDKAAKIVVGVSGLFATFFLVHRSVILNHQVNEMIRQGGRTEKQLQLASDQGERTERQLVNTAVQIELSRKQLQETQVNNLAKLLVDAASMIESEKQSDIKAGLAILHKIGTTENSPFVTETIAIIRDFLEKYNALIDFRSNHNSAGCLALYYLERICKKNDLTTDVDNVFVEIHHDSFDHVYGINYFNILIGYKLGDRQTRNKYTCCTFVNIEINNITISNKAPFKISEKRIAVFSSCRIRQLNIEKSSRNCSFQFFRCLFVNFRLRQTNSVLNNTISTTEADQIADFDVKDCYYIFENGENGSLSGEDLEWAEFLEKKGAKRLEKTDRAAGASHE